MSNNYLDDEMNRKLTTTFCISRKMLAMIIETANDIGYSRSGVVRMALEYYFETIDTVYKSKDQSKEN